MKVSVITPTWQRPDLLIGSCIPSVAAQTYPDVEHVIVSDGPDPDLAARLTGLPVVYGEVAAHDPHPDNWGSHARNHALGLASGDLIAYLDDDNTWRPDHLAVLVQAMADHPRADFGFSRMLVHPHNYLVGAPPPLYGQIDSSILIHRRGVPERLGCWPAPGRVPGIDQHAPDWGVVALWLDAGARWCFVDQVTVDYQARGN